MKTERSVREGGRSRVIFCLVLVAALVCGLFAINGFAAVTAPAQYDVKVVSCGTHTAALSSGSLYLWGTNDHGQFPDTETDYSVEPILAAEDVKDVAVSDNRTLVIYKNGTLYLYGRDPVTGDDGIARMIATGATKVYCGREFAMYITQSGDLMAWGSNAFGQLGVGSTEDQASPVRVMGNVAKAAAGSSFALALTNDGELYGWGADSFQQIGWTENGSAPEAVLSPVKIADHVKDVDAGEEYSCVLKENGDLYTCGLNSFSQAGFVPSAEALPLTKLMGGVRSMAAGSYHGFALGTDGKVYTWGYGLSGQLGDPDLNICSIVPTDLDFVQVFAGEDTSFGVSPDGSLYAWGANTNRLLCTASGTDAHTPMKVLNADMSWAYSEQDVPDEPPHNTEGGNGTGTGTGSGTPGGSEPAAKFVPFIGGYKDGTFRPNNNVTRAEFLKMVLVALTDFDSKTASTVTGFTDVPEDIWYAKYVSYALQNNLVNGYPDDTFRPNEPITRAAAAKIVTRALGLPTTDTESSFSDVTDPGSIRVIEPLVNKHILKGYGGGIFKPANPISRAEAAKIVAMAHDLELFNSEESYVAVESISTDYPDSPFPDAVPGTWYYPYLLRATGTADFQDYLFPKEPAPAE